METKKKYIITYDLRKAGQNYDGLIKAIEVYPHIHPMQSVWFIKSSATAEQIYKGLSSYIDSNDSIFIAEINWNRNGWMSKKAWDFLGE